MRVLFPCFQTRALGTGMIFTKLRCCQITKFLKKGDARRLGSILSSILLFVCKKAKRREIIRAFFFFLNRKRNIKGNEIILVFHIFACSIRPFLVTGFRSAWISGLREHIIVIVARSEQYKTKNYHINQMRMNPIPDDGEPSFNVRRILRWLQE